MPTAYFSRWILLSDGNVLSNGGISIEGDRIISVGSRTSLTRSSGDRIVNLGDTLLLPGMINMHTHLEEGILRGLETGPTDTFATWNAKKNSRIKNSGSEAIAAAVRLGIREAIANGITTIVDTSRTDISSVVFKDEPIRSWLFYEVHPDSIEAENNFLYSLDKRIGLCERTENIGIGPYALFSLSPDNHKRLIQFAKKNRYLWACHMAESAEELEAFSIQSGDLYFHITRKKEWPFGKTERGPMYYAITSNLIPNGAICYHCNYTDGNELSLLSAKNVSVVHCRQYNEALEHKPFPLDVAFRRGINICLGTESPSITKPMNLFDELYRLKIAYPHISAKEMLKWATSNPAKALGRGDCLGSLEPGKLADIIGLQFPHDPKKDIIEELMEEEPQITFVMINGEEIIM